MYIHGEGVEPDHKTAAYWLKKAAEQGHDHSQFNLGIMHDYGFGVQPTKSQAVYWWEKAAGQGHNDARHHLEMMNCGIVRKCLIRAKRWIRKALRKDYEDAIVSLSGHGARPYFYVRYKQFIRG